MSMGSSPRERLIAGILLVMVVTAYLVFHRHEFLSSTTALLAAGIMFVGLLPAVHWVMRRPDQRPRFPLMALAGVYYSIFYGGSVFLIGIMWYEDLVRLYFYYQSPPIYIDEKSIFAAFCGVTLMVSVYYLSSRYISRVLPVLKFVTNPNVNAIKLLSWTLIVGRLVHHLVPFISNMPTVGSFIVPAGTAGMVVLYAMWRRKMLAPFEAGILLLIAFPVVLTMTVATGFLSPIIVLAVLIIFAEAWMAKRLPWKSIVAVPVIFLLVYPVISQVRNVIWAPGNTQTAIEKVTLSAIIILGFYGLELGTPVKSYGVEPGSLRSFSGVVTRISHQLLLSRVIQTTPHDVPYWGGETYVPLISKLVPRAVWAEKPEERFGNEFGRRYGLLNPDERQMSVNLPWMPEMFANFGWLGLLVGMSAIGLLMAMLETFFVSPRAGLLEGAIGMSIVSPLFMQESNFSLMVGNIPLIALTIWLYYRFGHRILVRLLP